MIKFNEEGLTSAKNPEVNSEKEVGNMANFETPETNNANTQQEEMEMKTTNMVNLLKEGFGKAVQTIQEVSAELDKNEKFQELTSLVEGLVSGKEVQENEEVTPQNNNEEKEEINMNTNQSRKELLEELVANQKEFNAEAGQEAKEVLQGKVDNILEKIMKIGNLVKKGIDKGVDKELEYAEIKLEHYKEFNTFPLSAATGKEALAKGKELTEEEEIEIEIESAREVFDKVSMILDKAPVKTSSVDFIKEIVDKSKESLTTIVEDQPELMKSALSLAKVEVEIENARAEEMLEAMEEQQNVAEEIFNTNVEKENGEMVTFTDAVLTKGSVVGKVMIDLNENGFIEVEDKGAKIKLEKGQVGINKEGSLVILKDYHCASEIGFDQIDGEYVIAYPGGPFYTGGSVEKFNNSLTSDSHKVIQVL